MSLLLWLPFVKGNCKNQGLLDVETSTLGTINYEDGKLGKAVRIGNGTAVTNGIQINTNLVEEFGDEYSCSVWVKPTGSHVHYEGAILSSGNWNNKKWAFGIGQNNTTIDPLGPGYNYRLDCEIPINEWTHLVSTMKNNVATVYKNGELVGTIDFGSLVLESDALNTTIGRETYANGYFSFNGCIQDMRIYNHCLSRREIKELSKGLVCHYLLSYPGNENLIKNSYYHSAPWAASVLDYNVEFQGKQCIKIMHNTLYGQTSKGADTIFPSITFKENAQYTLSLLWGEDCTDGKPRSMYLRFRYTDGTYSQIISSTKGADLHYDSMTSTVGKTIDKITTTYGNGGCGVYISEMKLEEGTSATIYSPSSEDLGMSDNIEYDVSGYVHNGTRSNITYSSDSPRYNGSYVLNGTNTCYIGSASLPSETQSVSFWIKTGTVTSSSVVFADYGSKIAFGFHGSNTAYIVCALPSSSGYSTGSRCVAGNNWKSNDWNHIVVIRLTSSPSYTFKSYLNGVLLENSSANFWTHTTDNFTIGRRSSGSPFNGQISDFRAYATQLSDDDVLALYNTPITLSNNGILLVQGEYVEG